MQRRLRLMLIPLLATLVAMPHGAALHCNGEVTTIPLATETIYLDDRPAFGSPLPYIYLEANTVPGLQSGGDPNCLDECGGPDSLLFRSEPCQHASPDSFVY